jgi:1-pyrroline-4-hydroxy-2-carboxylate deaminase
MSSSPDLWHGVLVASTTPFDASFAVDRAAFLAHARWLAAHGVHALVAAGSVGEGATLSRDERVALVGACAGELGEKLPVVAAIGATRTAEAVELARACASAGAAGLMLLPPYAYRVDRRETAAYFGELLGATSLPCMLYNNPALYGTDVLPEQVVELCAEHPTLAAVKESSGDVRRITELLSVLGTRVDVTVGIDDLVVEGVRAGASGWVAGLANAFPAESVALFEAARSGSRETTEALYRWFLPLLRWDTMPKFVQRIKLAEAAVAQGNGRVRPPRFELAGDERAAAMDLLGASLRARPSLSPSAPTPR